MAVFGAYDVAFVSVTQNFSTAEAIGRLTLNLGRSRPWRPNDVPILLDTPSLSVSTRCPESVSVGEGLLDD